MKYVDYAKTAWSAYATYVGAHPQTAAATIAILAVLALVF